MNTTTTFRFFIIAITLLFFSQLGYGQEPYKVFNATGTGKDPGPSANTTDGGLAGTVSYASGIYTWTVPFDGDYRIEVMGASGGHQDNKKYGTGAKLIGEFNLTSGENIKILSGQIGLDSGGGWTGSGGGGGSFVVKVTGNVPLIIAAGGSGGDGNGSYENRSKPGGSSLQGDKNSAGVANSPLAGAAGGGFQYDGGNGYNSLGGKSFLNGGQGGTCNNEGSADTQFAHGGFGGGGAGSYYSMGGAGGGFQGGSTKGGYLDTDGLTSAKSYNSGSNQVNLDGTNQTSDAYLLNGYVKITQLYNGGTIVLNGTSSSTYTFLTSTYDPNFSSSSSAEGGSGGYQYQWQSSTDGTHFSDISGANSLDYNPTEISQTTYYRRKVTDSNSAVQYSNVIELHKMTIETTNIVENDVKYTIVQYKGDGDAVFTVPSDVTSLTYLVVGGGGGSGTVFDTSSSGGGGGGQVKTGSISVSSGNEISLSVGVGGAGGVGQRTPSVIVEAGASGEDSSFNSITALGGGGSLHGKSSTSGTGGSAATTSSASTAGVAGGNSSYVSGGGGGGSFGDGSNGVNGSTGGGAGGAGTLNGITGSSVEYGIGGRGGHETNDFGVVPTQNTGNGASGVGATSSDYKGGIDGAKGIVVVKYVTPCTDPSLTVSSTIQKTVVDDNFILTTSSQSTGTLSFSSSDDSIATINSLTGEVSIIALGTVTLTINQSTNGDFCSDSAQTVLTVSKKDVVIIPTSTQSKTYGSLDPILSYTVSSTSTITFTGSLGRVSGEDVGTYSYTAGSLSNSEYAAVIPSDAATFSITKKALTIDGITAQDKAYDETTTAVLDESGITYTGLESGDDVTASFTGVFSDANTAVGKTVNLTGSASGADVGNYEITYQTSTTATITASGGSGSGEIYTFTNAGATGRTGPTQTQINDAYAFTNLNGLVTINTQGIQEWKVPESGNYEIEIAGAEGYGKGTPGKGAILKGEINLSKNEIFKILVGQKGGARSGSNSGSGGGGSFFVSIDNIPFIVAGGGSGVHNSGTGSNGNTYSNDSNGGSSGVSSGGGGFDTDGKNGSYGYGGSSFLNGGIGGATYNNTNLATDGAGGFGGGGSHTNAGSNISGAGGGYEGGNGNTSTSLQNQTGGGSYIKSDFINISTSNGEYNQSSTDIDNLSLYNSGHGYVKITQLCDPSSLTVSATKSVYANDDNFTLEYTSDSDGTVSYNSSDDSVATIDSVTGEVTIIGSGTVTLTVNQSAYNYYCASSASMVLTVNKIAVTIVPTIGLTKVYGSTDPAFTYTVSSTSTITFTGSLGRVSGEDVGTYSYTAGTLSNEQYAAVISSDAATFSITKKALTIDGITAQDKAYDETTTAVLDESGITYTGLESGDDVTASFTGVFSDANTAVGKTVTLTGSVSGTDIGNYEITYQTSTTATITAFGGSGNGTVTNYSHTGNYETVTLQPGNYQLEVWGAEGGRNTTYSSYVSGKGGYSKGKITLTEATTVYIYVGGKGTDSNKTADACTSCYFNGGFNGGGKGVNGGAGGGGASDIRIGGTALSNRIIVAGGAGGSGYSNGRYAGGYGGGTSGGKGTGQGAALGGTQSSGYALGVGGNYNSTNDCGGGGGGYYGGYGGATTNSSGAGGSGYIGGLLDGLTIAGNSTMPDPDGGSDTTGRSGHGYARITSLCDPSSLTVSATKSVYANDDNFTLEYTSDSDGTVSYSSTDSNVATIDSVTGEVTIIGSGTVTLTVNQAAYNYYCASSASMVLTVNKIAVTVVPTIGLTKVYGSTDPAFTYTVSSTSTITFTGSLGRASGEAVGTYSYTAGTLSNDQYAAVISSDAATFSITKKALTIDGITAQDKAYDETTTAVLDESGITYTGLESGDDVTASFIGVFSDANTAVGKTVTLTGSASGANVGNYEITYQTSTTATITARGGTGVSTNFSYTGSEQQITLDPGNYSLEVWGAQGGTGESYQTGSKGGYAYGEINLQNQTTFYIYVGGQGNYFTYGGNSHSTAVSRYGGWNGGGGNFYSAASFGTGGGGTDISLVSSEISINNYRYIRTDASYKGRIIVAGGGAGNGYYQKDIYAGGGTNGIGSSNYYGTQSSAGTNTAYAVAGFGYGGTGKGATGGGNGGGGGWYGGAGAVGGSNYGGGGSGYVYTSSSHKPSGYNPGSQYYLTNTSLIAGNDSTMPNPSGGTMTGRSGHGYARITPLCDSSSLTVSATKSVYANDDNFTLEYTSDSDGTVSYSSSDDSIAIIDAVTGEVTIIGSGTVTLTVNQAAYNDYCASSASMVLTVNKIAVTVVPTIGLTKVYGSTDPAFTYTVSSTSTITFTGSLGRVSGETVGTYSYTAGTLSNDQYAAVISSDAATFSITKKEITTSGVTASDKEYDGTTDVVLNTSGITFNGIESGDQLSASVTGAFSTASIGNNKTVNLVYSFSGADISNYNITPQATTNASISAPVYNFTNAGASGRYGPTQSQVNSAYSSGPLKDKVTINTQGIQEWTVPYSGTYRIEAVGASGGIGSYGNDNYSGGKGAQMVGEFNLTAGEVIQIVVGQQGSNGSTSEPAGGGGGSFVYKGSIGGSGLFIAAGGGGGGGEESTSNGYYGTTEEKGYHAYSSSANYATAGNGSPNGSKSGAAAGWKSDGYDSFRGRGTRWIGGAYQTSVGDGGFGGGAEGEPSDGGGSGGGYTGGPTTSTSTRSRWGGGGGGSFNGGINQSNTSNYRTGHGYVKITPLFSGGSIVFESSSASSIQFEDQVTVVMNSESLAQGGDDQYTYQWEQSSDNSNWTEISDATSISLTQASITASTYYRRRVIDGSGATAYTNSLYVNQLKITTQPSTSDQFLAPGDVANALSVGHTSGIGTIRYQWYQHTEASTQGGTLINGATLSSFTPPTSSAHEHYYYVVITDEISVTSELSGFVKVANPLSELPQATGIWNPMMYGDTFDPNDDQQAVSDTDLVGNATHHLLQTQRNQYLFSSGETSDYAYSFRARHGDAINKKGQLGSSFYLGLDLDADKIADVFVEANIKDQTPYVSLHKADLQSEGDGTGPSNTGWLSAPNKPNEELVLTTRNSFIKAYAVPQDAYSSNTDLDTNGETDTWVEFAITEQALTDFAQQAWGIAVDGDSMVTLYAFTSTSQTANGDIAGIDDRTADLTKTWEELGVTVTGSLNQVSTNELLTPTVNSLTVASTSPLLSGTWGGDQGGSDTLMVELNGQSYTLSSTALTIVNTTWNLQVPSSSLIPGTTYTVSATSIRGDESKTATGTVYILDDDSSLASWSTNGLELSPSFSSSTTNYSINVGSQLGSFTFSATTSSAKAVMEINGNPAANGAVTFYNIPYGRSSIEIKVTAENGEETSYVLSLVRGIIPQQSIVNQDNITDEDGDTAQLEFVLPQQPAFEVILHFEIGDSTEGSLSTTSLTFTPDNWSTPQYLTVTGIDDTEGASFRDPAISYTISATASSSDTAFDGAVLDPIIITNQNTDPPGISVSLSAYELTESADSITANFALQSILSPTNATVTMTVVISDGSEASFSKSAVVTSTVISLTNTVSSTSKTIYSVDDSAVDGAVNVSLTTLDPSSDLDVGSDSYDELGASDVVDLSFKVKDDEVVGEIYSDFEGYWKSSSSSISVTQPNSTHNLVGFSYGGHIYTTGVSNTILTESGVPDIGASVHLDGTDDYIEINSLASSLLGDFTVEFDLLVESVPLNAQTLIFSVNTSTGGNVFFFGASNTNGVLRPKILGFASSTLFENEGAPMEFNTWNHISIVRSGNTYLVYINGILDSSLTAVSSSVAFNATNQVSLGQDFDNSNITDELNGSLDNFVLWTEARTADQIIADRTTSFTGSETNLEAFLDFNVAQVYGTSGATGTIPDLTGNHDGTIVGNGVNFVLDNTSFANYRALPLNRVHTSGTLIGSSEQAPTTSNETSMAELLTDGVNGLNLGSGVQNISNTKQLIPIGINSLTAQFDDHQPDLLISMIQEAPSSDDLFWFETSAGNRIGSIYALNYNAYQKQANWRLDSYDAELNSVDTNKVDSLQLIPLRLDEFGITSDNYDQVSYLVYQPSGSSDLAFIAYNSTAITAASSLRIIQAPLTYYYMTSLTPSIKVQLQDQRADDLNYAGQLITVSTRTEGATLSGTLTVATDSNGVADFTNILINSTSTVDLDFSAPGLASVSTTLDYRLKPTVLTNFPDFSRAVDAPPIALQAPTTTNTEGLFSYSISPTSVATIDSQTASLTLLTIGEAVITASQATSTHFTSASITATLTVTGANPQLFWSTDLLKTFNDEDFTVSIGATSSTGTYSYTSSNPSVATIDASTGVIHIQQVGNTILKVVQAADNYYASDFDEILLTVVKDDPIFNTINQQKTVVDDPFEINGSILQSTAPGSITLQSSDEEVITIDTATATIRGGGTAVITVIQEESTNYNAGTTSFTIEVNKLSRSLTPPADVVRTFNDPTYTLSYTTLSSADPVYTIEQERILTIVQSDFDFDMDLLQGTAAISIATAGAGTTKVTIEQPENETYLATTASFTVTVLKDDPILLINPVALTFNDQNIPLSATSSSTGSFTYSVLDSSIAIASNETASSVAVGSSILQVSQAADANYNAATATTTLTVSKDDPILRIDPIVATYNDDPITLNATSSSTGSYTYSSSDETVARIEGDQLIVNGAGTAVLTVIQSSDASYNSATLTQSITIQKDTPSIVFEDLVKTILDADFELNPNSNSSGSFSFSSSNSSVATINGSIVSLIADGETIIQVTQQADDNYSSGTATMTLQVYGDPSLKLSPYSATFNDAPLTLSYTSNSEGAVSYTSSDNSIVSINGSTAIIHAAGSIVLTAQQVADGIYIADTATTTISIAKDVPVIEFNELNATYNDADLTLSATSSSTGTYSFSSSDSEVAIIDGNQLSIKGAGSAVITVVQAPDGNYTTAQVTTTLTVAKDLPTIVFEDLQKTFNDANFELTSTSSSTGVRTYTSSNEAVASVSGTTVQLHGAGTSEIRVSQVADANYNASTATMTLTVIKDDPTIDFDALVKTFNDPDFELNAASTSDGQIRYSSSDPAVATISGTTVHIKAAGTSMITLVQDATVNYNQAVRVVPLTVAKDEVVISDFEDIEKTFNDADFELAATSVSTGAISYRSLTPEVAVVSGTSVTLVGAGSALIALRQESDSNYLAHTQTMTLTVLKDTPEYSTRDLVKTYGAAPFEVTDLLVSSTSSAKVTYSSSNTNVATVSGSIITIQQAGTTAISANQIANENYTSGSTYFTLTVEKATPVIVFEDLLKTYGDPDFELTAVSNSTGAIQYEIEAIEVAQVVGKTVRLNNVGTATITLTQQADVNYVSTEVTAQLQLVPKELVVSGIQVEDKVYDGTLSGTVNYDQLVFDGIIIGDDIQVSTQASFGNSNVGVSKEVTLTSSYSGTDVSNYTIIDQLTATASITQKPLLLYGTSDVVKVYDGTKYLDNSLGYEALEGVVAGDQVSVVGNAIYDDSGVGERSIQQGTVALSGSRAFNYKLNWVDGTGEITKKPLNVIAISAAKFVTMADPVGYKGVVYSGFVPGESPAQLSGTLSVTRTNESELADVYDDVLQPSGLSADNYDISYLNGNFTIVPADQLLLEIEVDPTIYSEVPIYTITGSYYSSITSEVIYLDAPTYDAETGRYTIYDGVGGTASFEVSAAINISTSGKERRPISKAGHIEAGSYELEVFNIEIISNNFSEKITTVGAITVIPKQITPSVVAPTKEYDGSRTLSNATLLLSDVSQGDEVSASYIGLYDDDDAGDSLGYLIDDISLTGSDQANYVLTTTSFRGSDGIINQIPLTVTASDAIKTYDGELNSSYTLSYTGFIPGENEFNLGGSPVYTGLGATAVTVGTYEFSIAGYESANYDISYVGAQLTIEKALISVSGIRGIDKIYDGTTSATLDVSQVVFSGLVTGEQLDVSAIAAFESANVGDDKTIQILSSSYSGETVSNYNITDQLETSAAIQKALITVSGLQAFDKVYNGTLNAQVDTQAVVYDGLVTGERIDITATGTFNTPEVGSNKLVNLSATYSGTTSDNYQFDTQLTSLATITKAAIQVTGVQANDKVYDGTSTASFTLAQVVYEGLVEGESIELQLRGDFETTQVGTNHTVIITEATYQGSTLANYSISDQLSTTASIIPAAVQVVGIVAVDKIYDGTTSVTLDLSNVEFEGIIEGDELLIAASANFESASVGTEKKVIISSTYSGSSLLNYSISDQQRATATISKANLKVKVVDVTGNYIGVPYPQFTVVYDGFMPGDSSELIGGELTFSGPGITAVTMGAYDVFASGLTADNYTLEYLKGTYLIEDGDADLDGIGDSVDPDIDGDGIPNGSDVDIDGDGVNDNGTDTDGDGINDASDDDIDGDGIPNEQDVDIDGDGINDNGFDQDGDGVNDANDNDIDGDGLPNDQDPNDYNQDTDGDGLPDGADADVDGDGVVDNGTDTDGDGIPDSADSDVDGDGIVDNGLDSDGDGINDANDPINDTADDDGDGIPNGSDVDIDGDGVNDNGIDTDGDGINDANEDDDDNDGQLDIHEISCGSDPTNADSLALDTDGDHLPDCIDTDDDNDGLSDIEEVRLGTNTLAVDSDSDGVIDSIEVTDATNPLNPCDLVVNHQTELAGIEAWEQGDCDQDGIFNIYEFITDLAARSIELIALDTDQDGIPNYLDLDDDNDGVLTEFENPDQNGDGNPADAVNTNASMDEVPDYLDDDDDGDGLPTKEELSDPNSDGNPSDALDYDNDQLANYLDPDDDNDGLTTSFELSIATDSYDVDTDRDGVRDNIELEDLTDPLDTCSLILTHQTESENTLYWGTLDCDQDGIFNQFEGDIDTDQDGVLDYLDADDDGDGLATHLENADPNQDGSTSDAFDADNDGIGDYLDSNSYVESASVDTDIEVYNAMSPNGDGLNDVFTIRNIELYPDNTLTIFNRWGKVIYEVANYGQFNRYFDGKSANGTTVPVGTYFYSLKVENYKEKVIKGYLYINK